MYKWFGYCSGLKCIIEGEDTRCILPGGCRYEDAVKILGLNLVDKWRGFLDRLGYRERGFLRSITIMYNPMDKHILFATIYLSRNTDYYRNTIRWIREIISRKCLYKPGKCLDLIKSYQYREYTGIWRSVNEILSTPTNPLSEAYKLLKLRGVGVKTIHAYLLHTYGLTSYAPIDRYYREFLSMIGVSGSIPGKEKCIHEKLLCSKCDQSDRCLYSLTRRIFGEVNGFIQSISYICGRLKRIAMGKIKPPSIEELVIIDEYIYKPEIILQECNELTNYLKDFAKGF